MIGWLADHFRLAWGLLYWNVRKAWFRLRRGLSPCPCQCASDSGRALETTCEASLHWNQPARFRRVCPLLVNTPHGLRCSVDTAGVRPIWMPVARYYGTAILTLYVAAVVSVFAFLRTVGYPVSIVHVALPPLWHKVGEARGGFFLDRSNRAFAAGKPTEGLLYLANAYEFDPGNHLAGLTLAKHYQVGHPALADEVFARLLQDHPDKAAATAQEWFRALLARGDFEKITPLAMAELARGGPAANVWMRGFVVATRQTRNDALPRQLAGDPRPAISRWRPLLEIELLLRSGARAEARAALLRSPPAGAPPYLLYYSVDTLLDLGDITGALDLLGQNPGVLDADAETLLRLKGYRQAGATRPWQATIDAVLAPGIDPARTVLLCAHLIRHPDPATLQRMVAMLERTPLGLSAATAGAWFSLLCTAGVLGERAVLEQFARQIRSASTTPLDVIGLVEAFFRSNSADRRITSITPLLPLPLEVTYALLERYSPAAVSKPA